jgi:oxygen-independent coproporphyrinogen-3 oxidase
MAGLYVHVPFCKQRCTYCDFYFVTSTSVYAPFVSALCAEIESYSGSFGSVEPIRTIYFGGGTPSRLPLEDINRILAAIEAGFDLSALEEVTIEINPDDSDGAYLRGLKAIGFTRVSLGIQSFHEDDLRFMNRSHGVEQASGALDDIGRTGFNSYSADLIFAIPDQPREYWASNLERLVTRKVPHISTYSLTVEAKTPLARLIRDGEIEPVDDDDAAEIFRFTMDYLRSKGYEHYEISSFALPGQRARHNQAYWSHNNYLGFGPSAHSFWQADGVAQRWANICNLQRYVALVNARAAPVEFRETLTAETIVNERIMLQLRTDEGFSISDIAEQYGIDLYDERVDDLAWLESESLIHPIRNDRIRLTDEGKVLCDMVTTKLMLG